MLASKAAADGLVVGRLKTAAFERPTVEMPMALRLYVDKPYVDKPTAWTLQQEWECDGGNVFSVSAIPIGY